jgi:UDP-N-acetylmuramate--alanine ligase
VVAAGGLDPTVVIGGKLNSLGSNAKLGQGEFLVAEADESDGSFLKLTPTIAVVTNIDEEHLDYYRDLGDVQAAFVMFANRVPFYGTVILPADDPAVAPVRAQVKRRVVTYGFGDGAEFAGSGLEADARGARFRLAVRGRDEGWIELRVSGRHNARNALAALAAGSELGIPYAAIREALHDFAGVSRRLESRGEQDGVLWIDDYGHHPTEIRAALDALAATHGRRVIAVFQPHRYTRTRALLSRFATCFAGVAELVLLPIYAASEPPIPGVTSERLADAIRGADGTRVTLAGDFDDAARAVRAVLRQGDLLVTIGAGDVYRVGELVRRKAA